MAGLIKYARRRRLCIYYFIVMSAAIGASCRRFKDVLNAFKAAIREINKVVSRASLLCAPLILIIAASSKLFRVRKCIADDEAKCQRVPNRALIFCELPIIISLFIVKIFHHRVLYRLDDARYLASLLMKGWRG